jgi:hypothetical protein
MPASAGLGSGVFGGTATAVAGAAGAGAGAGGGGGAETQALSKNPNATTPKVIALFRFSLNRFTRFPKSNPLCRAHPEWR